MATNTYKVLVDELTVPKKVGTLIDPISKQEIGIQQGQFKTYFKGEVIPESEVSPVALEALEDEDHPSHAAVARKLAKVNDEASVNTAARLGVPFAGYDAMDEDDILASMRNLPSAAVQAIKEYEATVGDGRERIVNYNLGYGESPTDRAEGRVGSDLAPLDPDKAVASIQTREVPEQGVVTPGEGITGTGDPAVAPGTAAAQAEEDGDDDDSEGNKPQPRRRSRRPARAAAAKDSSTDSDS